MVYIHNFFFGPSIQFRVMASPYGASRSHSLDTPHSVRLPWTNGQPDTETCIWQHTTLTTDSHPRPRRDSNPQSQQANDPDPPLRPRGHWDRLYVCMCVYIYIHTHTHTHQVFWKIIYEK